MSKNINEILKIIRFQTDLSEDQIAKRIGYSRPHLNVLKKNNDNSVVPLLIESFRVDILQFVRRFREWKLDETNSKTMDQSAPLSLEDIFLKQEATLKAIQRIERAMQGLTPEAKGNAGYDKMTGLIRKGKSTGKDKKSR